MFLFIYIYTRIIEIIIPTIWYFVIWASTTTTDYIYNTKCIYDIVHRARGDL